MENFARFWKENNDQFLINHFVYIYFTAFVNIYFTV